MGLRKAERLVSPCSQSEDWECTLRGSASGQAISAIRVKVPYIILTSKIPAPNP